MKKVLLLLIAILINIHFAKAQTYQLPNGGFENWSGSETSVPTGWHTFSEVQCDLSGLSSLGCGFVNENHHSRASSLNSHSGQYSCCIYSKTVWGHLANGNFTTGRIRVGNTDASDQNANYNFSTSGYRQEFTGYPDSIRFWASFYATGNNSNQGANALARLSAIIHDNSEMRDPVPSNLQSHVVASMELPFSRTTTSSSTLNWQCFTTPFDYTNNNTSAQYILITFTNNQIPEAGTTSDRLYMDDIEMVYNGFLSDIKTNGTSIPNFNKHTYNYTLSCCANNIPTITATAESSIANTKNQVSVTQATASNGYNATINRLGSDIVYTIHFNVISPTITLNNNGSYSVCQGGNVTMTASGADSYTWDNGLGNGANVNPPTNTAGNYTYTVSGTDANGCTGTATATVIVNALPTVVISGNTSICSGAATNLTAGGASSYLWSYNNSTSTSINVTTGGTYSVTGTASNGCESSTSVTVTEHTAPTVSISSNPASTSGSMDICAGNTVTLTASGASTYSWTGGLGNTATVTPPTSDPGVTTYTVTGTDDHGCTGTASFSLTVKQTPTVEITSTITAICSGVNENLTVSYSPNTATLTWTGGGTPINNNLQINQGGHYTVTASLNGCESSDDIIVTESETPAVPTVTPASGCAGETVTLHANGASGTTCYWYASLTTNDILTTGDSYTTGVLSQNANYYVSAKNDAGCYSGRVMVTATINQLPNTPSVTNTSICGEGDITLTANPNDNIHWYTDAAGNNPTTANQHISQTSTFYAAVIDGNGCRSGLSTPMTVTMNDIPTAPSVSTTPTTPICSNSNVSVQFNVAELAGHIVKWYDSEMQSAGQGYQTTKTVSGTTTYYATYYNNNTQCESAKTPVEIVINPIPNAPTLSCNPICGAGEATLNATADNGLTVKWYTANNDYITSGSTYSTNIPASTVFKATTYDENTGCESQAASVTAVVNPTYNITDPQTACDSYTWEGTTYTQSGSYEKTLSSVNECDSVVTLQLTIINGYNQTFDTTVCDQFVWGNNIYTTSGSFSKSLTSVDGCDSTVTYNLTVKHSSNYSKTLTLCSNELPYVFAGDTINSAGTKTITLENAEGCDSVITLTVVVNNQPTLPSTTSNTLSRCGSGNLNLSVGMSSNSAGYHWYTSPTAEVPFHTGTSYEAYLTENTTYYVSSFSNAGCESERIEVSTVVNPVPADPQVSPVSRCGAGEVTLTATADDYATTVRWYNNNNNNAPVINTGFVYNRQVSAPQGDNSYTIDIYADSYNESTQCASANRTIAVITVNPAPTIPQVTPSSFCGSFTGNLAQFAATSSSNNVLRWYDNSGNLMRTGNEYDTTLTESTSFLVSSYNPSTTCESGNSTLAISIFPNYEPQSIYDTVCQGTHYQQHGIDEVLNTPGDRQFTINQIASTGCDSTVTLYICVKPQITNIVEKDTCDSYAWNGIPYSTSGSYEQTFTAANGCDSVVTLMLTIHNSINTEFSKDTCNSYTWNNETYSASGDYTQTFSTINGCDSTVTLHLTIYPVYNQEIEVSACQEYVWNNTIYSESGDYVQDFSSINGCDSIVTMHLTIHQAVVVDLNDQICVGAHYTQYGFDTTCLQDGTYTLTHQTQNVHGCDSTTILHLTVNPVYETVLYDTICFNQEVVFNGEPRTTTGVYTANLQSVNACDSTVILNLFVYPERRDSITAHICAGQSYTENGFDVQTPATSGNYSLVTPDIHGCDSTTVLQLFVHQPVTTSLEATLCLGEQYNEYGFEVTATEVGIHQYIQNLQGFYGCDSTVVLTVTVNPTHNILLYGSVCAGEFYSENGFDTIFTQPGVYPLTNFAPNQFGCDSTTILILTVYPVYNMSIQKMICEGASYVFDNQTLTEPGTYQAHFTTIHGCDSLVTLNLTIGSEYRDTINAHICEGASYNLNGFNVVTPAETMYDSLNLVGSNGCDSISVLHLFIHHPDTSHIYATLCLGESYRQHGFNVTPTATGDFTDERHTYTQYGCDSTIMLHLTVNPISLVTLYDSICAESQYSNYGFDTLLSVAGNYTLMSEDHNIYGCDSMTILQLTVHPTQLIELTQSACDSFVWNDSIYTASGDYTQQFTNVYGCDSTVITHLTIRHSSTYEFDHSACVSYQWNDSVYTASGDYVQQFINAEGCDSTVTLHLTIYPAKTNEFDATACVSYQWNDSVYTASGDYVQQFQTVNGCDSTVTLHLTIYPVQTDEFDIITCVSYQWNDSIYTASGDYVQQFQTVNGCDSTVTLHLTIQPDLFTEVYDTACVSYQWNDSIYAVSGEYVQHFESVNGCDSTVTLHLTIYQTDVYAFAETACDSYTWNDSTYVVSGEYVQHFENMNGCDSTVTLHLTIHPIHDVTLYDTICLGTHYTANGFDTLPSESGLYTLVNTTTNVFGCDSVTTLLLTVYESTHEQYTATVCQGNTFNQYGFDTLMTEVGVHVLTHEGVNIHGCDSTVTVTLTVNPSYSIDTTANVCDVDLPFVWNNYDYYSYTVSGDYDIPFQTASGCDSIIHLHLVVNPTYDQDTTVTVCQGALPYFFDADHSFSQGGVYQINLTTATGCDSIWHLHLSVTPNAEHTASQTICDSQLPYTFMGEQFFAAGTYDITESDGNSCLTITHFTLDVNPTYHHFDTVTVCQETLPYLYGTTPLSESGSYDIHFSSVNSCDSLVSVLFNVIPTASGVDELFVCSSDFPVSYGDSTFAQEGVYEVVFHRDALCDSVVTLSLHQAQEYLFVESDSVCDHSLPYLWRGMALNYSGVYVDSLYTQHGCDSVYRLNLTVNETQLVVSDPIVLCQGESETWRGMTLSEAGTYRDTATAATGCYEIYEVSVTVNPSYLFLDTVTLCSDELPYLWHGMTLSEAGTREDFHQTVGTFCDSVYRLTLYVNPSHHVTETASACDYDLPYLWHGQSLSTSGVYYDTMATAAGCDSTFALTFTVNASQHEILADTVCQNSLPYAWRGHQINAAGSYADTIPNAAGCMDIFELHLAVLPTDAVTIYDTVCAGSLYDLHGFDTLALLPGTLYDQLTLSNVNGCDSVVNLVLAVLPNYLFEEDAQTCENVPYVWRGNEILVEGTYYDSLLTVSGCDSVYILHLSLNPTFDVYVSDSAMREHEYTYDSFVITPADSGTFNYDIQYYTLAGCDSIVHLTLYVAFNDGVDDFSFVPDFSFYPNPTQAMLNIRGQEMKRVDVFNLNGKLLLSQMPDTPEFTQLDVARFATGHYLVKVLLNNGHTVTGKIIVNRR